MSRKLRNTALAGVLVAGGYCIGALDQMPTDLSAAARRSAPARTESVEPTDSAGRAFIEAVALSPEPFVRPWHIGLLLIAAGAFGFAIRGSARSRGRVTLGRPNPSLNLPPEVERLAAAMEVQPAISAPRTLLQNPWGQEADGLSFDERVRLAAQGSVIAGRVIGVIHFHLGGGEAAVADPAAPIADRFRAALRATDHVRVLDRFEIIVFISLLPSLDALRSIAGRLKAIAEGFGRVCEPGLAMYPIDGYSSGELIEAAAMRTRPGLIDPVKVVALARA